MDSVRSHNNTVDILLVEDNPGDIRLTQEAIKESKLIVNLAVVMDGAAAVAFLRREGEYADAPKPDLILLDLNLPKKSGIEVLSEIKKEDSLKRIPVVVLTVSEAEEDIIRTYNLHANCYIQKPLGLESFIRVVQAIENFWLTIVKLPPNGKHG